MTGFESRAHEQEFAAALARKEVPLKFAYAGAAAATYSALAATAADLDVDGTAILEVRGLLATVDASAVPTQVCDVGPGNGRHTGVLLQELETAGAPIRRYLALDFSSALMEITRAALAQRLPDDQSWRTWDFELGPTDALAEWRAPGPALLVLGGTTLGNAEDPLRVVENLRDSAECGDLIVLSVGLAATVSGRAWGSGDRAPPAFTSAALQPLAMAGLLIDGGTFRLGYDPALPAVVGHFELLQAQECNLGGQTVSFAAGERIRCFLYRCFTRSQIGEIVTRSGMTLLTELVDDGARSVLVFSCR